MPNPVAVNDLSPISGSLQTSRISYAVETAGKNYGKTTTALPGIQIFHKTEVSIQSFQIIIQLTIMYLVQTQKVLMLKVVYRR